MHIFLYEWASGGGLVDEPGGVPPSLLREGAAMVQALAADLTRIDEVKVTALRDMRVLDLCLPRCEVIDVHSAHACEEEMERLAGTADATLLIAPEFDGILETVANRVVSAGGRLLSPGLEFIRVTSDKHTTAACLAAAGIAVPEARLLETEEQLPADFFYPAVLKPIDGAGSQDTQLLAGPHDTPQPYAWTRRLERFCPGLAASAAFLCGESTAVALPPCRQRLSTDGRLRYLGGEYPLTAGLAARVVTLGQRALAALPAAWGYVGVDVVLGQQPDGSEDFFIEANPRLTTSYVGLRAACRNNLAEQMIRVWSGKSISLEFAPDRLEFDTTGNVSYVG